MGGRARRRRSPGPGEHRGGGMDPGRHVSSPRPAPSTWRCRLCPEPDAGARAPGVRPRRV